MLISNEAKRSRVWWFGPVMAVALSPAGCSDEQRETGTLAQKPAGADAGEKASMDAMKAMMKSGQVKGVNREK
jgi:hypothetical protein